MNGRHKGPAAGSRIGALWKGALPLGLAAGAALFVGGGVDLVHRHQRAGDEKHAAKPAAKNVQTEPRYVVGVRRTGIAIVVRDVRTGSDVGLPVAAPQGRRFHRISSVQDGSYVVSSYAAGRVTFQRLRLEKNGHPKYLENIPKATLSGVSAGWSDMAVNPDGDRIAYVTYQGMVGRVDVISSRTGIHKEWTTKVHARISSLSWAGNTLSFVWNPLRTVKGKVTEAGHQVRALNTSGPSGDLKLSKPLLMLPTSAAVLTQDGRTIVTALSSNSQLTMQAFSVETRKPTKVLWRQPVQGGLSRLDTDRTGAHLLVSATDGRLYTPRAVPAGDLADAAW